MLGWAHGKDFCEEIPWKIFNWKTEEETEEQH
jgi:hypothetical protein